MRAAVLLMGMLMTGQQLPTDLPPSRRVSDPARPDFGFTPWAGTEFTIVIAFGADCEPCVQSVASYKRLSAAALLDGKARRMTFLSQGGVWPVIEILETHPEGFKSVRVVSYPSDDRFGLKTLPTLWLIDGTWKRRGEWRGRLTQAQEGEVLAMIDVIGQEAKKAGRR
jgi:hypothetical protein